MRPSGSTCMLTRMDGYDAQIAEIDQQLYKLYRFGSRDIDKIDSLWARLELLEATRAKLAVSGHA